MPNAVYKPVPGRSEVDDTLIRLLDRCEQRARGRINSQCADPDVVDFELYFFYFVKQLTTDADEREHEALADQAYSTSRQI